MDIKLPMPVQFILNQLNDNGYEAYVVGGCVRDSIMGFAPHDWDICTSALPEQVIDVFKDYKVIPTGIQHGTVSVVLEDTVYEITTYRVDGEYKDNRHPDSVEFVSNLKEDLARRDFTINAMAYNDKDGLIDYFGGIDDIKHKFLVYSVVFHETTGEYITVCRYCQCLINQRHIIQKIIFIFCNSCLNKSEIVI